MNYNIIYDAVKKKAKTDPPNILIGNVEMAASIGIILHEMNEKLDFSSVKEPGDIKAQFENLVNKIGVEKLSEISSILLKQIEKYQVKVMVNETLEDLKTLVGDYQ